MNRYLSSQNFGMSPLVNSLKSVALLRAFVCAKLSFDTSCEHTCASVNLWFALGNVCLYEKVKQGKARLVGALTQSPLAPCLFTTY